MVERVTGIVGRVRGAGRLGASTVVRQDGRWLSTSTGSYAKITAV